MRRIVATEFGGIGAPSSLVMCYGFPWDVRNLDVAERLSSEETRVMIPHPCGIEDSEGDFAFSEAGLACRAGVTRAKREGILRGIVGYCYSSLWALGAVADYA